MSGDPPADLRPARPLRRRPPTPEARDGAAGRVEDRLEEVVELLHASIDHLLAIERRLDALEAPASKPRARKAAAKKSPAKAPAAKRKAASPDA